MISFWNALIICSAMDLDCDVILSEDLNSNRYFEKVRVVNPFL